MSDLIYDKKLIHFLCDALHSKKQKSNFILNIHTVTKNIKIVKKPTVIHITHKFSIDQINSI